MFYWILFGRNHLGVLRGNDELNNTYRVNTMTQRFKSKYATIKFYTSKAAQEF